MAIRTRIAPVLLLLGLAGCAAPIAAPLPEQPTPAAAAATTPPLPPDVRRELGRQWIDAAGVLRWPADEGFAEKQVPVVLPPGLLLDRFGDPYGAYFSPKGAAFSRRALPYRCADRPYTAYEVLRPVLAWTGKAAPWFDEPGGATQFKTDASAASLVADGSLRPLPPHGPPPCK